VYSRTILAVLVGAVLKGGTCVPVRPAQQDPGTAGPYAVGFTGRTFTRTLADGTQRKLTTDIRYPAQPSADAPIQPYLGAALNIEPSDDTRHPLIIFSHGCSASPPVYSLLLNHLASHGFVVAALDGLGGKSFAGWTTDRFFVVVPKAGHEFADRCFGQAAIVPCSSTLPQDRLNHIMASLGTAFLLRYVATDPTTAVCLIRGPGQSTRSSTQALARVQGRSRRFSPSPILPRRHQLQHRLDRPARS
jgi:hypothetical protein